MEKIAIVNRKGGAGKTTTAHAIGAGLAKRGYKVLFVDLDSQTNLSLTLSADTDNITSLEVLTGEATAKDAIQHTGQGDIIAASQNLAGADMLLSGKGAEYRLKKALEPVQNEYDFIIMDTPGQLGLLTVNALTAADSTLLTLQADSYNLLGLGLVYETISAVKKHSNKDLTIKGILATRYDSRTILSRDMLENIGAAAAQINTRLFEVPIRECVAIKEAQAYGLNIFDYAPRSNAAKDYTALLDEIDTKKQKKPTQTARKPRATKNTKTTAHKARTAQKGRGKNGK